MKQSFIRAFVVALIVFGPVFYGLAWAFGVTLHTPTFWVTFTALIVVDFAVALVRK